MSENQFDHIDDRIRDAAENSEPGFDEKAWAKMEARLDREDNRKRRILLWGMVLPLLFITAGSIYFILNNKPAEKVTAIQKNKNMAGDTSAQHKKTTAILPGLTSKRDDTNEKIIINKEDTSSIVQPGKELVNSSNNAPTGFVTRLPKRIQRLKKGKLSSKVIEGEAAETVSEAAHPDTADNMVSITTDQKKADDSEVVILEDTLQKADSSKSSIAVKLPDNNNAGKIKTVKSSRFYLLASFGADAANVKLVSFHNNRLTAKYGVGIGYQLNNKISLQSGFYAGRKKYIAGPGDYVIKAGSYWNMVKIIKIDASCLVYDIPLTVRYTVLQKPTTGYYATAGISSFIMKKEDYEYYYLRNNMYYEATRHYTGNRNFFSVFTLAAGIEKKISPYFFILAEPSVSIPLSGVGDGSVKLYSTALQLAIKYQPPKKMHKHKVNFK